MGCCACQSAREVSGLLVPDQEIVITELEHEHPFSQLAVHELMARLAEYGMQGGLNRNQFLSLWAKLGLAASLFEDSRLSYYLEALKHPSGEVDVKQLLLTGLLLSHGQFESKLSWLMRIYNVQRVGSKGVIRILKDLVYAATVILPSLAKEDLPLGSLDFYLARLRTAEGLFISSILNGLGPGKEVTASAFAQLLRETPNLHKLFWSNGVRMLLIEEDIKLSATTKHSVHASEAEAASALSRTVPYMRSGTEVSSSQDKTLFHRSPQGESPRENRWSKVTQSLKHLFHL